MFKFFNTAKLLSQNPKVQVAVGVTSLSVFSAFIANNAEGQLAPTRNDALWNPVTGNWYLTWQEPNRKASTDMPKNETEQESTQKFPGLK